MPAASRPSKSLRPSGIRPGHVCRGRHRPAHAERLSLPAIKAEPLLQPGRQGSPAALPVHGGCRRSPFAVPEGSLFLRRPEAAIGAARPSDTPKARRPVIPSNGTDRVRRPQLVGRDRERTLRSAVGNPSGAVLACVKALNPAYAPLSAHILYSQDPKIANRTNGVYGLLSRLGHISWANSRICSRKSVRSRENGSMTSCCTPTSRYRRSCSTIASASPWRVVAGSAVSTGPLTLVCTRSDTVKSGL